jgi:dTDP-L-rhamnose 4-epimerase
VSDLDRAHLTVLYDRRADFRIFNVGSGVPHTVRELAETVTDEVGIPPRFELPGLYRVKTARHSTVDISHLSKLGWRPKKTLRDNVRDYVTWIRNYPEAKRFLIETLRAMRRSRIIRR